MKKLITGFFSIIIRLTRLIITLAVLALATVLLINMHVKRSASDRIITPEAAASLNADCILVLGAGVYGNTPSTILEDRLLRGIQLYENQTSDRILMSGDHGKKYYDEVTVMKQFAIDREVPSKNVFMDHAGFSTYESMYRARQIFQAKKIVIVTQEYHLYRALYIAKGLGLDAYGVASDQRTYSGQQRRDIREVLARTKDFFTTLIQPLPTYLGDVIPVSGDGDLTND